MKAGRGRQRIDQRQRRMTDSGLGNDETEVTQHIHRDLAHLVVIVHDQYRSHGFG